VKNSDAVRKLQCHLWVSDDSEDDIDPEEEAKLARDAVDPQLTGDQRITMDVKCTGRPDGTQGCKSLKSKPSLHAEHTPHCSSEFKLTTTFHSFAK
jgi:hypothetical protein